MSYLLYSSIARAGGIDLLLSTESFAQEHRDQAHHRRLRSLRPSRLARLRRGTGRALVALGGGLTAWGRNWAAPALESTLESTLEPSAEPVR